MSCVHNLTSCTNRTQPGTEGASWPAVPFSVLNQNRDSGSLTEEGLASPPRIAFNGISTDLPKSPFQNSRMSGPMSDESLARKRELEEEQSMLYPPLNNPSLFQRNAAQSDSPVIPLSPDPFGRFPSEHEAFSPSEGSPPEAHSEPRDKPVSHAASKRNGSRNGSVATLAMSEAPSSRFSLDSIHSPDDDKSGKGNSLMSVKSIKKLWRKTNNKMSISGSSSPAVPDSGRSTPNPPNGVYKNGDQPVGFSISRTMSRSPQPGASIPLQPNAPPGPLHPDVAQYHAAKRQPSQHNFQWNQETPYPVHPPRPAPTPPLSSTTPPPAPSVSSGSDRNSVRKSILKSFKSSSGSLSAQSNASTPRSSSEAPDGPRRRRPSVAEIATSLKRASGMSSSMTLVDIPPSPALPEQFASQQSRSTSRQSLLSGNNGKRMSTRQKASISSTDSLSSRAPSRLVSNPSSPPRSNSSGLSVPRASTESQDSRPSFDESQFEIVSPKQGPAHTLSYPYHGLDNSMTSAE